MAALCRKYFGVAFGTESQFILRYQRRLARYGDLSVDNNLRRLIRDLTGERYFRRSQKFGWVVDPEAIFAACEDRTYAAVLDATFRQLARRLGMTRWGDKTPAYIADLPTVRALFHQAQFIHVVRDGRDTALSGLREPVFGTKHLGIAAWSWREKLRRADEFAATLPSGRYHEIRYEDLLDEPERVVAGLIAFLRIDDRGGELEAFIRRHIRRDLYRSNARKWMDRFSVTERRQFEEIAGQWLHRYGYPTDIRTEREVGRAERLLWQVHDQLRKHRHPAHWRNTVYRLRLRGRALVSPIWCGARGLTRRGHDGRKNAAGLVRILSCLPLQASPLPKTNLHT